MPTTSAVFDSHRPTDPPTIRLRDHGELITAIPHLLGFCPENSVVLLGHEQKGTELAYPVIRLDLPAPADQREMIAVLAEHAARHSGVRFTAVLVGGHGRDQQRRLIKALIAAFRRKNKPITTALGVPEIRAGARWFRYDGPERGELPDSATSILATASVAAGTVTFPSRDAMQAQLDPDDPATISRRAELLNTAEVDECLDKHCREIRTALTQAACGDTEFSDQEYVRLAIALGDVRVRDACLTTALPLDSARSATAEKLWIRLARALPAPERAEPACLLAYSAYLRGDGVLAGMALDVALHANPEHVLGGLLIRALEYGMPPSRLAQLGERDDVPELFPVEEQL